MREKQRLLSDEEIFKKCPQAKETIQRLRKMGIEFTMQETTYVPTLTDYLKVIGQAFRETGHEALLMGKAYINTFWRKG